MPDTIRLWPAEALFLLKPNLTNGLRTIRVAVLSLLARGVLRVEEQEEAGLFRTRKVPCLRIAPERAPALPPHLTAVIDVVRAEQAGGGRVRDVVKRAEMEFKTGCFIYNSKFIVPGLVERGLMEVRSWWVFRSYRATPDGERERLRIKTDIARARRLPDLLKSDPAQAAELALALGGTLLLADDLGKHYRQLASAIRTHDGGGGSFEGSGLSASFDLGGFDLGSFDSGAFDALDASMSAFDAGFSDGGGDGGGGDGGHH
jgi:hypothetical protein